jgi:hypothetical protein
MKTDNHVGGKYFAEVMKEVLSDVEVNWDGILVPTLVHFPPHSLEWAGHEISAN